MIANVKDYAPIVARVMEYLAAEMDATHPPRQDVIAYCETNSGDCVELTLSDLVSVAYLAAEVTR